MHHKFTFHRPLILFLSLIFSTNIINAQTHIYWVGGNGDWDDSGMWYKDPGGVNPAGIIPNQNSIVHFTNQSSTIPIWSVRLQPGSYDVHSILVETSDNFRIYFNGTDNNEVDLNVYGDISLLPSHRVEYASTFLLNNIWKFVGSNNQNVTSGGHNLSNIAIQKTSGTFNQLDDLTASEQIRMFAGTWNSNSNDVTVGKLLFEDDEPSSAPLPKLFNAASSDILCQEWESGFTYGSLVVTGNHIIRTKQFRGSPKQLNGQPFSYNEIHLLEYPDVPNGTPIEYNNFECRSCIIETLTIEDTGDTKLADKFTVNGNFTVVNQGSTILFNGGNNRDSEVTFNGSIKTPKVTDCTDPLTIFSSIHTDESLFIRDAGTLNISDAVVNNIITQTSGSGVFNLFKGVLQGASDGWNIISDPEVIDFYWKGISGANGDWDDPDNWMDQSGNTIGCIPTIKDDVYITQEAKGGIRIPRPYNAECRNFYWTNKNNLELILDGTNTLASSLTVSGNFDLDQSATITPVSIHEIYFSSTTNNYIKTSGVQLPEVLFIGTAGEWTLQDNLNSDILTFEAGTFNTNGFNVVTDVWNAFEEYAKHFNFSSSTITVNGIMDLAEFPTRNITIDAGTSLIQCEVLNCIVTDLYDVQFNNSSTMTMDNYHYNFHSLILNGTGELRTTNDLTLDNLIYMNDGSTLALDAAYELFVNAIESMTSAGNPGVLKSQSPGTQVDVSKPLGNLCVVGNVEFIDINGGFNSVFHAPNGIDGGNNDDIIYDTGGSSTTLYWISPNGGDWHVKNNWSRVNGGCPDSKDPDDSQNLEFNRNSFTITPVNVTIQIPGANANNVTFKNAENLTIEVLANSTFKNLDVDGGFVNFIGTKELFVNVMTTVQSSGFLTTDLFNFTTIAIQTVSGVLIVRSGSNFNVDP